MFYARRVGKNVDGERLLVVIFLVVIFLVVI